MNRAEVEDEWDDYSKSQRRYNSFTNEWDLAKEFDPEGVPSESDYESDDEFYCDTIQIDHTPLTPSTLPPPDYIGDLTLAYGPPTPLHPLQSLESLDMVIYNRYGFNWKGASYNANKVLSRPRTALAWTQIRKVLVDSESQWYGTGLQDPISDFIDCFITGQTVPSVFWDISSGNRHQILNGTRNTHITVRKVTLNGRVLYLICPQLSDN